MSLQDSSTKRATLTGCPAYYKYRSGFPSVATYAFCSYSRDAPNLDHQVGEGEALNLDDGTGDNGGTGKDFLPALDGCGKGRIHICHEQHLIDYVLNCRLVFC